jgi:hypothetical protein
VRLITQVWDSEHERYVEGELDLCGCLPPMVERGLWDRSQRLSEALEPSDDPEVAESA